jgi:hypothetical protein
MENVYDFYNDEMIQSFSNRKIAQLSAVNYGI